MKSTKKQDIAARIAKRYGVSTRTVSRWKKERDDRAKELNAADNAPIPTNRKRQLEERRLDLICQKIEQELKLAGDYVPYAEYERRAKEYCQFVYDALMKFRNDLPPQLTGCDMPTISSRIVVAIDEVFEEVRARYKVTYGPQCEIMEEDEAPKRKIS